MIHALGTDLTLWDDLIALLPAALRILRVDLRGHGRSDVPPPPSSPTSPGPPTGAAALA